MMTAPTWTPPAVASERKPFALTLWRAVEAQHVASTMPLVDSLDEQAVLEAVLDAGKPAVPPEARHLHYLIFTPFRYPASASGSRFRSSHDPGVFYGAQTIGTACAELGYLRWRFLLDCPDLPRIDAREAHCALRCGTPQASSQLPLVTLPALLLLGADAASKAA